MPNAATGQYATAITVIAVVMVVSLVLPLLARKRPQRERSKGYVQAGVRAA